MPEALKNIYSRSFIESFAAVLKKAYPKLDEKRFIELIFDKEWEARELKQRMRHIAEALHKVLPAEFAKATDVIISCIELLKKAKKGEMNFEYMFFPDFVEVYGLNDYKTSIAAFEKITQFTSAEFAVRPFLIKYPEKMQAQMLAWSKHPHAMVRRLASEGFRPRLPWAMAVPYLKKDPSIVLPVLGNLKNDPSETVRRSVANNLNDIAKDHPDVVMEIAGKWYGKSVETDKLIRHGCRTLLKRGNTDALAHFGFADTKGMSIDRLATDKKKIKIGDDILFSFNVSIAKPVKLRVEYAIDFVKANGKTSRKVFKMSEGEYRKGIHSFNRKQSFRDFTTRKHYPGKHTISILLNGKERSSVEFVLV